MQTISNRQLTFLRKLQQKKYRQQEQLFIVEGERAVQQVIKNRKLEIKHLFFDKIRKIWEGEDWQDHIRQFQSAIVKSHYFGEITDTDNPQGVMAVCEIPTEADLMQLSDAEGILVAVDRIQDPGNLGTMVRSATWFGVKGLLSGKGTVDLFHPKVVRSTAGSTGSLPYVNVNLENDLKMFEEAGWQILLLDAGDESIDIRECEIGSKTVIVVGNEANGIDPSLMRGSSRKKVRIESSTGQSGVESLNASIALSIGLFVFSSKVKGER